MACRSTPSLGRAFSLAELRGVADDLSEDRLLETLEEALAARSIEEIPQAVGRYQFTHALIRETLYDEVTTTRRVRLHRRIGESLEALYGANLEPHLVRLAHHFWEAAHGGDVDKAIEHAVRAAERAIALLAYEEAARHYELGLHLLDLKEPADNATRCKLLLALGEAQRRAGQFPQARDTFFCAADLAKILGSPEDLARAAWASKITAGASTSLESRRSISCRRP